MPGILLAFFRGDRCHCQDRVRTESFEQEGCSWIWKSHSLQVGEGEVKEDALLGVNCGHVHWGRGLLEVSEDAGLLILFSVAGLPSYCMALLVT